MWISHQDNETSTKAVRCHSHFDACRLAVLSWILSARLTISMPDIGFGWFTRGPAINVLRANMNGDCLKVDRQMHVTLTTRWSSEKHFRSVGLVPRAPRIPHMFLQLWSRHECTSVPPILFYGQSSSPISCQPRAQIVVVRLTE